MLQPALSQRRSRTGIDPLGQRPSGRTLPIPPISRPQQRARRSACVGQRGQQRLLEPALNNASMRPRGNSRRSASDGTQPRRCRRRRHARRPASRRGRAGRPGVTQARRTGPLASRHAVLPAGCRRQVASDRAHARGHARTRLAADRRGSHGPVAAHRRPPLRNSTSRDSGRDLAHGVPGRRNRNALPNRVAVVHARAVRRVRGSDHLGGARPAVSGGGGRCRGTDTADVVVHC